MSFNTNFYSELCYLNGTQNGPCHFADIKSVPEDFKVDELMTVDHSGEGEHLWLEVQKTAQHTDQVAKSLAKLTETHIKNIGFSGMKDYRAQTSQWFSVCLPGVKDQDLPDWSALNNDNVEVKQVCRHHRKLKRGTHQGNHFKIRLRNYHGQAHELEKAIAAITHSGVPNYFGEQRFGRGGSNLQQALDMLGSGKKIKQRQKRSMLLSAARSWLFNLVLSERLKQGNWLIPQEGEPLNLSGSKQLFIPNDLQELSQRIENHDVNTTAPLWGINAKKIMEQSTAFAQFESEVIHRVPKFAEGLLDEKLEYARRSIRCLPQQLQWKFLNDEKTDIQLSFYLAKGQFATSVLREIVQENGSQK